MGHQVLHLGVALLVAQVPALGLLHHGVGHGVREMFLQTGGKAQHLRRLHTIEGDDSGHPGTGMGEGAGLVKDNGIRAGHSLQELASLDRDVLPPRLTHGREHRQGHGQFQGTGEVYHEHRQGPGQVPGERKAHQAAGKGIGYQFVCQVGCFGFGGGLHLL